MRWLGLAVVPLIVAASFLGLLIGITGLCVGADDMHRPDHPITLCLFFCGVLAAPVVVIVPIWIVLAALCEQVNSRPSPVLASIFRPPIASPA